MSADGDKTEKRIASHFLKPLRAICTFFQKIGHRCRHFAKSLPWGTLNSQIRSALLRNHGPGEARLSKIEQEGSKNVPALTISEKYRRRES